jgi:hypothetical protein
MTGSSLVFRTRVLAGQIAAEEFQDGSEGVDSNGTERESESRRGIICTKSTMDEVERSDWKRMWM